jgi:uncharacterized protein YecT (DUF1311 family)
MRKTSPLFCRVLSAATLCCCLPLAVQAEKAATDTCYEKAQTQLESNACAEAEYKSADQELNRVYQAILKKYKDDAKFIAKFREAQRAWLKYRDAELEAKFPHAAEGGYYGSIFPLCDAQFRAELTRERIARLRVWLDGAEEGDACSGSVDVRQ